MPGAADASRRSYLTELRTCLDHQPVAAGDALAVIFRELATGLAVDPSGCTLADRGASAAPTFPTIPAELRTPALLGHVHEALFDRRRRRRQGAFFTPEAVASGLVERLLDGWRTDDRRPGRGGHGAAPRVCDPAVGGGAFLLAAADALESRGHPRGVVVEQLLWGIDIDPLAVEVAEASLLLWSADSGQGVRCPHLVVADTLEAGASAWSDFPAPGFEIVVGNPPFQNQLGTATARTADDTARLRARWGPAARGYVDSAALFLLAACEMASPGGRVSLILPQSFLAARDAEPVRAVMADRAVLRSLWIDDAFVFDAGVRVCAPVFDLGANAAGDPGVRRWVGAEFRSAPDPVALAAPTGGDASQWAPLLVDGERTPLVVLDDRAGLLGTTATATAGFRAQYYGLTPFVIEAEEVEPWKTTEEHGRWAQLVTSGLIEPARCVWGERRARFAGRPWQAPLVDRALLAAEADPALVRWANDRLVPKVVVATQTRVIEAAVDLEGTWWPSVPTIAVTPRVPAEQELWRVAAVLLAPAVSAWALARYGGVALTHDAVKLAARQVLEIPLPVDDEAWASALDPLRRAATATNGPTWIAELTTFGAAMGIAYGVGTPVLDWWLDRLPSWSPRSTNLRRT